MINEQIQECIQKIFNNELGGISKECTSTNAMPKYQYMTAYRLSKFIVMYRKKQISRDDLLISLRNYLLLFKTAVRLPDDIDITDNEYGLRYDADGLCYATLNLPEYLNEDIVKQGFMDDYVEKANSTKYFLGVTPNIYRLTGYTQFKSLRQKLAVTGALNMPDGYTALISLPTGGGKSLITQTMAYQKGDGLTITVVPTVSLALDQVRVAKKNIKIAKEDEIACYYSDLSKEDKISIINRIKSHTLRLLFISPEALIKNELFKQTIDAANESGYLKNLVIDEAHIVIEWGNFFRVDYQCLEPWRNNLFSVNSKLRTVLLSATYEKNTVKVLQSMFSTPEKWIEIRCDALRREPRFDLVIANSFRDKNSKIKELLKCLPRPMIVYVMRPDQADKIKEIANEIGITNIETFTGRTKSDERSRIIDEWSDNEFDIIIATSAFGVGVDKSDVRTVLLLRRYNLIKVLDMIVEPQTQIYFIRISILDERLLQETETTKALIEEVRNKEWNKNESEFKTMSRAVLQGSRVCWSEMFFNTYSMVSEYCAGCNNHKNVVDSEPMRFELLKKVTTPIRKFEVELDNMFAGSDEAILFADTENSELIGKIINKGFALVIVDDESKENYFNLLNNISGSSDVNLLGMSDFNKLVEHGDYYYFSGDAVILYEQQQNDLSRKIMRLRKSLETGGVRLLHVFENDVFCEDNGKYVSSIIDGPVLEEYLIERM